MKTTVYIVTKTGYEETDFLGVFATKELAEKNIDYCVNLNIKRNFKLNDRSQYDILEETVEGLE